LNAHEVSRSQDGRKIVVSVSNPSTPPIYQLVDLEKRSAGIVGESYPALANAKLGVMKSIAYKARDGYDIPAYLTTPPDAASGKLPLVVLPHGGPQARDYPEFDWLSQFLATRGYLVLQPQFRGSIGFGQAHRDAGYRQWGGVMQNDVTDGVKAMIDQGLADPKRVCIVGASYGGYAALAGAAFTPELYACAASIAGVSDLGRMLGYTVAKDGNDSDSLAYWKDHMGSPHDPGFAARSPLGSVERIGVPILLLHGADDTVVPIQQSELMAATLKEKNKPYKFVKLAGEDHWLSRSETRVQVLEELEAFLAQSLAPRLAQ
jgi:dipeptidyl aminopeptidase/acylaminoacyl peptidase